jgi:hypothetical protein
MKRKILAFVCVWSLLLSLFAVPAFAAKENYTTLNVGGDGIVRHRSYTKEVAMQPV